MENSAVLAAAACSTDSCQAEQERKIKVGAVNRSAVVLKILVSVLLFLTVYAFWSFDYKEIQLGEAIAATLHNMKTVFLEPKLSTDTIQNVLYQLLVTFCLGILSTIFGAVLAGIEVSEYDYKNGFRVHMLGYSIARPEVTECLVHPTLEARHANSLRQIEILNRTVMALMRTGCTVPTASISTSSTSWTIWCSVEKRRRCSAHSIRQCSSTAVSVISTFAIPHRWKRSVPSRTPAVWLCWRTADSSRISASFRNWQNRVWTDWN